jgi:ABC-type ATPase involved in cell division
MKARGQRRLRARTVLVATHDEAPVEALGARVLRVERGAMVAG